MLQLKQPLSGGSLSIFLQVIFPLYAGFHPENKNVLFKYFRWVLPLAAALALSACKESPPPGGATRAPDVPAPAAAPIANAYDAAAKGAGFTVGSLMATRQIYVFFDPQCPHCGHLWEAAKPLTNQLRMVWIPVGFISARSTAQGAALLAATDPMAAMSAHEQSLLSQKGGLIPPDNLPSELTDRVKANTKLWQQLGGESVPMVVFKNPTSGEAGKFNGALDTQGLKRLVGI